MTHGYEALVDDEDYDYLNQFKWRAHGRKHGCKYATAMMWDSNIKKSFHISMHRFLLKPLGSEKLDHINGNGLDNRRCNLRVLNNAQNCRSFKRKSLLRNNECSSKYRGVYWKKSEKKWCSQIVFNYKRFTVGYFKTEQEAAIAWNKKAIELGFYPEALNKIIHSPLVQQEFPLLSI